MAPIFALTRIDDRMVHGQVAIGWVKATHPDYLVVVNDAVTQDPMLKSLMEMATPPPLQVLICEVAEAARIFSQPAYDGKRILMLFASVHDVQQAVAMGLPVHELNVGGMRYHPGKRQIMKAVAIDDEDVRLFKDLLTRGLKITIQMVPTDEPVDIQRYL